MKKCAFSFSLLSLCRCVIMYKVKAPRPSHKSLFNLFVFLQLNHEGKCEFMIISCPSCKEHIRFNEQERHNERECPERTLNCKYCKEPFHFKNIKVVLFRGLSELVHSFVTAHYVCFNKSYFVFFRHMMRSAPSTR